MYITWLVISTDFPVVVAGCSRDRRLYDIDATTVTHTMYEYMACIVDPGGLQAASTGLSIITSDWETSSSMGAWACVLRLCMNAIQSSQKTGSRSVSMRRADG